MKQPIFDSSGRNVSKRIIVSDAYEHLPASLSLRVNKQIGVHWQDLRNAVLPACLITPVLLLVFVYVIPFIAGGIFSKIDSDISDAFLLISGADQFHQVFALLVAPLVFLSVMWHFAQEAKLRHLSCEKEDLILEIAYKNGQDQSLIRDKEGKLLRDF